MVAFKYGLLRQSGLNNLSSRMAKMSEQGTLELSKSNDYSAQAAVHLIRKEYELMQIAHLYILSSELII
jgi:hypothetical protein